MALWVNEQLLGMRDFELKFYVSKSERDAAFTTERFTQLYIEAAMLVFGVRVQREHVAKQVDQEDEKTYRWTYSWQPATGDAYIPQYDEEFTLKTMTYSLPKGLIKLRVKDKLKRTMEDDSTRDRFFELSSWDDVNNRWIYREVAHQ